ncbi:hypothetical protein RUM44_005613 [Polyplax serrata]|uniref:Uncharacterized protein n=1 Tax=Polyplax serrata TaxID=468196 RepID=A0ABR1ADV9_POLSC
MAKATVKTNCLQDTRGGSANEKEKLEKLRSVKKQEGVTGEFITLQNVKSEPSWMCQHNHSKGKDLKRHPSPVPVQCFVIERRAPMADRVGEAIRARGGLGDSSTESTRHRYMHHP